MSHEELIELEVIEEFEVIGEEVQEYIYEDQVYKYEEEIQRGGCPSPPCNPEEL